MTSPSVSPAPPAIKKSRAGPLDTPGIFNRPGPPGAFAAEFVISFVLLSVLLIAIHHQTLKPWLGIITEILLLLYITFEPPFSGMSLNPVRTVASALPARSWKAIWIYFTGLVLAMLLAAIIFGD